LNIFVIPSWFPSRSSIYSGIFIKEQIDEVANRFNDIKYHVSLWGQQSGHVSLRSPYTSIRALLWRLKNYKSYSYKKDFKGINYYFSPSLSWSHEIPFGGAHKVLNANIQNLERAILASGKIDLIHAHVGYPGGVIANYLSKKFKIPYIISEHMGPYRNKSLLTKKNKLIKELEESFHDASVVLCVSQFLEKELKQAGIKKTKVIPNIIDEDLFSPAKKKKNKFIFLTLCNLVDIKGLDVLMDSISSWKTMDKNIEFWIGGSGPLTNHLKSIAQKLNIDKKIKWLGDIERKRVPNLYKKSSAFVLPSRYETFGVVYGEALCSGIPIIATKCGGPEQFFHIDNGILIEKDNPEQLLNAMQKIHKNYNIYDSDKIRSDFLEQYSKNKITESIRNSYLDILQR